MKPMYRRHLVTGAPILTEYGKKKMHEDFTKFFRLIAKKGSDE